jgi:uncharacterized protein YndB with AHSA1/START domain
MLNDLVITKKVNIHSTTEKVWDTLVNPEKISLYLFGTKTVCDWKKNSPIEFRGEWEGKTYTDKGTILEIEENRILKYSYRSSFSVLPDIPENYSIMTFTIQPQSDGVMLILEQRGFPDDGTMEQHEENWNSVIELLKKVAES